MTFERLHKVVTYALAGMGLFALTFGRELQTPAVIVIAAGYVASWFVEEPLISKPAYAKLINRLAVAFFAVQVVRGVTGVALLPLGIEYAAVLQLSRLFCRRTAREHQHIAVLAFLHLIVATVLSTGLDYAAVFLGFILVIPWMLALTHLRAEIEGKYGHAGGSPERREDSDVPRVLRSRRIAGPGFLAGTALLVVPLFAFSAALFLLFPRVGMGLLSFERNPGRQVTGFGGDVQLGGFGVIRDDPTVVLRVKAQAPGGRGLRPPFRLRGTSFDHYDGRSWTRTTDESNRVPAISGKYPLLRWPEPSRDERLRIILDPLDERVLFLPHGTVALSMEPHLEHGQPVQRRVLRSPGLDVRYAKRTTQRVVYDAYVSDEVKEGYTQTLDDEARARYLQLPAGVDRVTALARRLTEDASNDAARAARIRAHLRDSGRYRYTLEQPDTHDEQPLDVFLFEARAGHCEYFSSAMAVMLRAVGVPARNVTGFLGGQYNQYGGYYAIRQGDAHSWVEAYIDGRWMTFDPTPSGRRAMGPGGLLGGVRDVIDALRVRWTNEVIDYDLHTQIEMFRDARDWFSWMELSRRPGDGAGEHAGPASWPRADDVEWKVPLGTAAAVVVLVAIAWAWRRVRRGTRRGRRGDAVALYRDMERRLARAGHPRGASETPMEHAHRLDAARFAAAGLVREVTHAYLRARFGDRPLPPEEAVTLRRRLRRTLRDVTR